MDIILTLLIPGVVALLILGVFVKMAMPRPDAVSIEERLTTFAERPKTLEELELEQPFSERVVKPMVAAITRFAGKMTPSQTMEKQRTQLILAGNPYNMQVTEFTAMRLICAVIFGVLGLGIAFLMQADILQMVL